MTDTFPLPPLRQELRLEPGTPLPSGAPGYVLFDPLRHLFFQLGALEQRVLAHWRTGEAHAVRAALVAEGEDAQDAEDAIVAVHDFALANALTLRPPGDAVRTLAARDAAARQSWWKWLLDHYLFVRVPLVRPAAFLARTLPVARTVWSPAGLAILATLGLLGALLVTRQWDGFTGQFAGLMTGEGLVAYAAALLFVKAFHEFGHAYTATAKGARVPTMGVSFLVMMPVLYTDTSAAWRLRSRRSRMAIDAAGIAAELSVAAVALFLWSFLPDGPVRTAAFILATTSLATSLLVNASPFMRFDGYYLLSDLLGVPNLAPRAFALARWRMRELLFALGEPAPEPLPQHLARAMTAYAVVTIAYRTILYVGIALLVYHKFFKALGIALFVVEVAVFLVRPVAAEFREWRKRAPAIRASRRARLVAGGLALALVLAFLPLDRSVSVPAVLAPIADQPLAAGDPARIERVLVADGATVTAGQPLIELSSPDIALGIAQATLRIAQLESRIARGASDAADLADATVLRRDLIAERDRLGGLEARRAGLTLRATQGGRVVDLSPDLAAGMWTDGRAPLARIVSPDRYDVAAYADERDGWRLEPGTQGRFVPDDAARASSRVRLDRVGSVAIATLDQPLLAQTNGGPIAVGGPPARPVPKTPQLRLRLVAEQRDAAALPQPVTGRVILSARGESLAARLSRAIGQVLVRETSLN